MAAAGQELKSEIDKRIKMVQEELAEEDIDLALFTNRENVIYLTGVTQAECMGVVVPTHNEPTVVALWLDVPHLKENCAVKDIRRYHFPSSNLAEKTVEVIRQLNIKNPKIGFGKYFVEFNTFKTLREGLSGAKFTDASELIYKVRSVKSSGELENIQEACNIVVKGMESAIETVEEGLTEVEVLAEAEYTMRKAGSEVFPFRMQVVAGERQLLPHSYAGNYKIQRNQTVVIHLGASYKGYCAKMCRTVALGKVPSETKKIYSTLLGAQKRAIESLNPPIAAREVYGSAREVVDNAGYGKRFLDVIGYGIGLRQAEFYPVIGKGSDHLIRKNMVVDLLLPTIYDEKFGGPRIDDIIQVTSGKPKIMTDYERNLIEI